MYNTIIHPTWLSIVFENRNQAYGAFQLRKEYEKNMVGGLILSHAILAGFFGLVWMAYSLAPKEVKTQIEDIPYDIIQVTLPSKPNIIDVPKPQIKATQKVSTKRFVPLVVKPDNELTKTEVLKQEDLEKNAISSIDNKGTVLAIVENPVDVGSGTNIGTTAPKEDKILEYAETMPSFPTTHGSLASYVGSQIKYPRMALQNDVSGKVYVQFIIDENGNIIHPQILRGLGFGCDEEVLRILAMMPKWNPGQMNGKSVKVRMTLPVNFKME